MSVRVDDNGFPVAEVRYPTPGPASYGEPAAVAAQRAELGLSDDDGKAEAEAPAAESKSAKSSTEK